MDDLFGSWADLNCDGEVDDFEKANEYDELDRFMKEMEPRDQDEDDDLMFDLDMAGLDYDELSWMDESERRKAIEDAGLDPDDYDF